MSETNFPRAGFFTRGYDPSQVDEFFADARKAYEGGVPAEKFSAAQVRGAHFDLVRRGYQTSAIDQAMDAVQVDELLDRLAQYFDSDEGITSAEIRNATFKTAKNEKAYKEGVVDAYLSRAVEVLLAVE